MTLKVNIEQLQAFCATADTGSFSATGRLLGKSQSAVSTQVMQLEEIIDYQLFERGYKPKLTKRGELLLRQADRIIRQLNSFERHAYILHSSQHTIFRIGIDYSIYLIKFFDFFSKFSNKYPTLEVQITQLPPSDICKFMREARLDMALCFSDKSNFEFNCKQLGTYTNHLVVSKNHPLARKKRVTFSDLQDYRHIVVCSPYDKPEDIHSLSPYHYEVNSYLYALSLVAKGIGFTCLPKDLIDTQHIFYDSLCFINDGAIPLDKKTLSIIWQDGADNYELCRKVISEIKTEIF